VDLVEIDPVGLRVGSRCAPPCARSGMPVAAIRCYAELVRRGDRTGEAWLALLREHGDRIAGQMRELSRCHDLITHKIGVYQRRRRSSCCSASTCRPSTTLDRSRAPADDDPSGFGVATVLIEFERPTDPHGSHHGQARQRPCRSARTNARSLLRCRRRTASFVHRFVHHGLQIEDRCAVDRLERKHTLKRRRLDRADCDSMQADGVRTLGRASSRRRPSKGCSGLLADESRGRFDRPGEARRAG
jgi:hypothetical protein